MMMRGKEIGMNSSFLDPLGITTATTTWTVSNAAEMTTDMIRRRIELKKLDLEVAMRKVDELRIELKIYQEVLESLGGKPDVQQR